MEKRLRYSTALKENILSLVIVHLIPVTNGYEDLPTVVNNVETLASVPPIVR